MSLQDLPATRVPAALRSPPMASSRLRPAPRRHLFWLLWLGLLFAFAQAAANAHAISHVGQDGGRLRDGGLVHAHCDLCLIGASIGGAAPLPEPPPAVHPALGHVLAAAIFGPTPSSALALAYRSRAPPTAPR